MFAVSTRTRRTGPFKPSCSRLPLAPPATGVAVALVCAVLVSAKEQSAIRRNSKCFMVLFSRTGWLPGPRVSPCVKFLEDSGVVWQCGVQLLRMLLLLAVDFLPGPQRHVHPGWLAGQRSRRILFGPWLARETRVEELQLLQAEPVMARLLA